jgi:aromatic ring-opening dioxygenase catalytic subunit (LigB family)
MVTRAECEALERYLQSIPTQLPRRPKALLVVSAHWEEPVPTVMTHPQPPMFYDYYGFPEAAYRVTWPAPGAPEVAKRVRELLGAANIPSAEDPKRGFDHGTFVPLKVAYPAADIPTLQLSLQAGLDPRAHLAIGRALRPLRDEGVLLVGSGMSFHDLRALLGRGAESASKVFDGWLLETVQAAAAARDHNLERWASAPGSRQAHPREEHLLPLMVIAGAAGEDRGTVPYQGAFCGAHISAAHFGVTSAKG